MKILFISKTLLTLVCFLVVVFLSTASNVAVSGVTEQVVSKGISRVKRAQRAQKKIDKIYKQTEKKISAYQVEEKVVQGLLAYNKRLSKTVAAQEEVIGDLQQTLTEVGEIERQVLPLMVRMLDAIDQFIALDTPFLKKQRLSNQKKVRDYMVNSKVPLSERFRLVVDSYKRENNYGKTIEAYTDTINFNGKELAVDLLRVGRVALYFQTKDESLSGVWDKSLGQWVELPRHHNPSVRRGIRIAAEKQSPDLLKDLLIQVNSDV